MQRSLQESTAALSSDTDIATPPEWLFQRHRIQTGEIKWDDLSFEERTCKGWLWPYLLDLDRSKIGSGRWDWWIQAHLDEQLPDTPIPQIDFLDTPFPATRKMLEKCLDVDWNYRLPDFLEWILWGFGEGTDKYGKDDSGRPRIDEKTNEKWYRTFNLDLMIQMPHDYWGELYSETKGRGRWNRSGFYPTPHPVVECMVRMLMSDVQKENQVSPDPVRLNKLKKQLQGLQSKARKKANGRVKKERKPFKDLFQDEMQKRKGQLEILQKKIAALSHRKDPRTLSVMEPALGTGRMLMLASNYSVNLYGADIDYVCIAASKVNGYIYVPWMVRPAKWLDKTKLDG